MVHALAGRPDYPEDSELEKMRQVAIGQLEPSNDIKVWRATPSQTFTIDYAYLN